jgi:hypothetical protein
VLLARRLFRGTPLALDHLISAADTAADRGSTGGTVQRLLRALDRAAVGAASIPFVDTAEQLSLLPEGDRPRALVVPVGAPAVWFHPPGPDPTGPVRVVF